VVAVGGDAGALEAAGLDVVADLYPGEGPLGGLITALRWSPEPEVVVAACDLPWLDAATVRALLGAGDGVRVARTDRLEPLCACWPVSALPAIEVLFAAGERAVRRALHSLEVIDVAVARAALRNVNTPADLSDR
jgi:molybdopterin-guanine dinucleotide biosynthesis protein A